MISDLNIFTGSGLKSPNICETYLGHICDIFGTNPGGGGGGGGEIASHNDYIS